MKRIIFLIVILICFIYLIQENDFELINEEIVLEIGSTYDFSQNSINEQNVDITINEEVDFNTVGVYKVLYKTSHTTKSCTVTIQDTTNPIFDVKEVTYHSSDELNAFDFIEHIKEHSGYKVYFDQQYQFDEIGEYQIGIVVEDSYGNVSIKKTMVEIVEDKVVYLTFDDGPSHTTEEILNILDNYQIQATFFVSSGEEQYHNLIQEAYNRGHAIGLHSYSHDYKTIYQAPYLYFNDLSKIDAMVYDLIGVHSKIIRFPGGSSNTISSNYNVGIMSYLVEEVTRLGYTYYDWNVSSEDAKGTNVDVHTIIENATNSNLQYINLLMHDSSTKETTIEALPTIIEYYLNKGYIFKTLEQCDIQFHQVIQN